LSNVRWLASVPRTELPAVLAAGDVHLVSIRAGCENLVFPSKLAGIAAVGRPALVVGPRNSEPARLVSSGGWGEGFGPEEIGGMTATLRRLKDDPVEWQRLAANALTASARLRFDLALSAWERILIANGDSSRAVNGFLFAS